MAVNKDIGDSINVILSKDDIRTKFEELLEKYPNVRYCLFAVVTDKGGCFVDNEGIISGLEYLGLAQHLYDICENCGTSEDEDGK